MLHLLTNGQYGFHHDELDMLGHARFLVWGHVSYPSLAPFMARVTLDLFGPSLIGPYFFAAWTQSSAMVLAGLIACDLSGQRRAQIVVALATATTPLSRV